MAFLRAQSVVWLTQYWHFEQHMLRTLVLCYHWGPKWNKHFLGQTALWVKLRRDIIIIINLAMPGFFSSGYFIIFQSVVWLTQCWHFDQHMLRTSDKMLDPSTDKENSLVVTTKFVIYQFLLHCDRRDFELSVGILIASVFSKWLLDCLKILVESFRLDFLLSTACLKCAFILLIQFVFI